MSRASRYALILLVSLAAHLPGIRSPLLDYHYQRQTETATVARNYHETGAPFLSPRVNWNGNDEGHAATEFPLYTWMVGLLWPLFGWGDAWGRLVAIVCSALTAVVLFRFLEGASPERAWLETEPAFYAACLFAVVPVEMFFGRTVQPEAMALLCSVAALACLDRHLDAALAPAARGGAWLLAAIFAALAVGLKIPYLYLIGVCATLAWSRLGRDCLKDPRLWAFAPAALIPVGLWYRYANSASSHLVPTSASTLISMLDYSRHPAIVFRYAYFLALSRFPEITTTYPGLVLFAVGMRGSLSKNGPRFLLWWWLCVWVYTLAGGGYTYQHEYTALPFAPINAAFMGLGLHALLAKTSALTGAKARRWANAALAAMVLGMPLHAALRIRQWYRVNFPFLLQLRPVVDGLSGKNDLFLCNQGVPSLYLYFIDRRGWSWDVSRTGESDWNKVEDAIRTGAKYFLTAKDEEFSDPAHPVARRFYARFPLAYDGGDALIFRLTPSGPTGYNTPSLPSASR